MYHIEVVNLSTANSDSGHESSYVPPPCMAHEVAANSNHRDHDKLQSNGLIPNCASTQAHIPYRNQKLTMLMSDSLGGSAKTLMFVNVSPTDSNLDETQTSLQV